MKTGLNIADLEIALDIVRRDKRLAEKEYTEILETETTFKKFYYLRGYQSGKIEVLEELEKVITRILQVSRTRQNLDDAL